MLKKVLRLIESSVLLKKLIETIKKIISKCFLFQDSEDSDGEGGLGNVSRVIIRPPGHSGKAKRGHLVLTLLIAYLHSSSY